MYSNTMNISCVKEIDIILHGVSADGQICTAPDSHLAQADVLNPLLSLSLQDQLIYIKRAKISSKCLIKSWILVDQSDIWIPKCTEGGGDTDLGNFPKF